MFVRAYLRASTEDQTQSARAISSRRSLPTADCRSPPGKSRTRAAKLSRPELFRLLNDAQPGDIMLVEQVDRLSRLTSAD